MKNLLSAILLLAAVLVAPETEARSARLDEASTITLNAADGSALDAEATRQAILAGAGATPAKWTVVHEAPGRIQLSTQVRNKHTVVMAAVYSAGEVRFDYVSSVNMNHKVRRDRTAMIHPNYMAWRSLLEDAVRAAALAR